MTLDGTYTAVLDRIEDDLAVLEVVDGGEKHELVVECDSLPAAGRHPDAVLELVVDAGDLRGASYDDTETEARKRDAQSRFDRLSSRPPDENRSE